GLYDPNNNTITIYFASNYSELIHTLTHEFGHALGMQHVENSQSIMYPYTTSSVTLTPEDLEQLAYVCRKQSLPLHWLMVFQEYLSQAK
ncbi:MAG: matrixin family metalloprotease, partial [Candidatus Levyibacteriota bacterium]